MRNQLVEALLGGVRVVLVVAALGVALAPIGQAAIRGFCPGEGAAASAVVAAPPAGIVLATVLEPTADPTDPLGTSPDATSPSAPATGTDGTGPDATGPDATEPAGEEGGLGGRCPDGADRCLPPLISAVLEFGDGACGDEAQTMLRDSMLPAFGIATMLLAGAWALRPRHGEPIVGRH